MLDGDEDRVQEDQNNNEPVETLVLNKATYAKPENTHVQPKNTNNNIINVAGCLPIFFGCFVILHVTMTRVCSFNYLLYVTREARTYVTLCVKRDETV